MGWSNIHNAQIGVITNRPALRRRVKRAITSTGAVVSHVGLSEQEVQEGLQEPRHLYIVDADAEQEVLQSIVKQLRKRQPKATVVLTCRNASGAFALSMLEDHGINNLLAKHGTELEKDDLVDERELIVTCNKALTGDIFGIEKYLSTWGVELHHDTLGSKDDKGDALTEIRDFLANIDCHASMVPLVLSVADELMMNAMYSAPRDRKGRPKYATVDRREAITLKRNERVDFHYGCDGHYFALSVSDRFGSLERNTLVKYLGQGMTGTADVEYKAGGAGLGLFMIYTTTNQLVFNIHAGVRTEVVAQFFVRSGVRQFKNSGHSLNVFIRS